MKNTSKNILCIVFVLMLMVCPLTNLFASAKDDSFTEHEIAVVLDNSAALYEDTDVWCQVKYALELWGAMLDFEHGDKMTIFPMWGVSTGKQVAKEGGSLSPITISSGNDIQAISYLYTPGLDGTERPFEPVNEAFNFLNKSKKSDKWLVILTADAFNMEKRSDKETKVITPEEVHNKIKALKETITNNLRVQYINVGDKISENQDMTAYGDGSSTYAVAVKGSSKIPNEMVSVLNRILNRNQLDSKYIGKETLTVDLTMSHLIFYFPDKESSLLSFKDKDGKSIKADFDTKKVSQEFRLKYSATTYSHGQYKTGMKKAKSDRNLEGQLMVFNNIKPGAYSLTYNKNIKIFYEPDLSIDLKITTDAKGNDIVEPTVDGNINKLEAGKYYLFYEVVDNGTSKNIESSPLVNMTELEASKVKYVNGQRREGANIPKSGTEFSIAQDETLFFDISATYLNGSKLRTSDNSQKYTFLGGTKSILNLSVNNVSSNYIKFFAKSWKPIRIDVKYMDSPATAEILRNMTIKYECDDNVSYTFSRDTENSCFYAYIGKDSEGSITAPDIGRHNVKFIVTYSDGSELSTSKACSAAYEVILQPVWLPFAITALVVIILFVLFMVFWRKKLVVAIDKAKKKAEKARIDRINRAG